MKPARLKIRSRTVLSCKAGERYTNIFLVDKSPPFGTAVAFSQFSESLLSKFNGFGLEPIKGYKTFETPPTLSLIVVPA